MADSEIQALIRLLDDPDDGVFQSVRSKLISYGKHVVPTLESEWELNAHVDIQTRIELIIHQIEFDGCIAILEAWKSGGAALLVDGALATSAYQYPEQDNVELEASLELIRKDVWLELNDNLTSLEKVRVINHILYGVHDFGPDLQYHSSDQNWMLKNVLQHHKGSPTAMGILYTCIAQKLELPIVAIDLPVHMILGYRDVHQHTSQDILFYINPFSKGAVFGRGELERYMTNLELEASVNDLQVMSNLDVIRRLLTELSALYKKVGKYRKLEEVEQLLGVL